LALEAEVQASIDAVRTRFAERLADGRAIYAGYSQGATMGALFLPAHAADFPVLVLTEGGFEWTLNGARKFGRAGGSRVVFVCGTEHCANHARMSVAFLTQVGVLSDLRLALGAGHTETGAIGVRLDALADSFLE
jgi:predicted esterase